MRLATEAGLPSLETKASLVVLLELSLGESRLLLVRKIITVVKESTLLVGRICDASDSRT